MRGITGMRRSATVAQMKSDLADLIEALIDCPRPGRIDLREPILAHGASAVGPLREAAGRNPDLGPSVSAWLEVLAGRDSSARQAAVSALLDLASEGGETARYAAEGLRRLGVAVRQPTAPGSGVPSISRSAGTEWKGFQAHEFGRNAGTSWRSADGRESLAPLLTVALRNVHPGFISFGVERSPEIHFALAHRYKGGQASGFTSSKLVVYAEGPTEDAPSQVVAGWYFEKGDGKGEAGPLDDGQRWDWPLVLHALERPAFRAGLSQAMAKHGLSLGDYVGGRFSAVLGWVARLEEGTPVARDASGQAAASGWDEIGAALAAAPPDQWIDVHLWRTWPAEEAIAASQPFALEKLAPCLIDLARLYVQALGSKA